MTTKADKELIQQLTEASRKHREVCMEIINQPPPKPFPSWAVIFLGVMFAASIITTGAILGSMGS